MERNQVQQPSAWDFVGKVVVFIGLLASLAIVRGLVLSALWGWFVTPLGPPDIGIAEAIGISLIVGMLTTSKDPDLEDKKKQPLMGQFLFAFGRSLSTSLFMLLLGFVVHLFQ